LEVLSHYKRKSQLQSHEPSYNKPTNLFQNLRESSLVDLNKLLQLVEIIAEQAEPFVQSHVARRQLGGGRRAGLERALLVEQGSEAEFELREKKIVRAMRLGWNREIAFSLTHFGFLLKVEFVDLLQLALQSEEEGSFVRLQRGLRVLEGQAVGLWLLGGEDGGFAQVLDELFGGG
jgi:microcompartment protein CcmK/EutM